MCFSKVTLELKCVPRFLPFVKCNNCEFYTYTGLGMYNCEYVEITDGSQTENLAGVFRHIYNRIDLFVILDKFRCNPEVTETFRKIV